MLRILISVLVVFLIVMSGLSNLNAQTCSCAGAPLLGAQSSGADGQGNLLMGVTYEFNQITNLYSGSTRIDNDSANRNTQSVLLEVNYGITDRLSATGTFSFVRKERVSGIGSVTNSQRSSTSGIGDGIIMLRYAVLQQSLWNRYNAAIGIGGKAPLGSTDMFNSNGLRFNADMQPGTGAWDGVIWSNLGVSLLPASTGSFSLTTSFRRTGTNERFTENDDYRFGNEFISMLGFSNSISDRFGYTLNLRYRSTSSDRRNETPMPNTGGKWLSFIPDLSINVTDNSFLKLSGQIPLYQRLNGLQPTTTYAVSASLFLNFNSTENQFKHANR